LNCAISISTFPWLDSIRRAVLQEDMSGMLKILGSFRRQAVKDAG